LYTVASNIKEGDIVTLPIYNISYIVAVPKPNATITHIDFEALITIEVNPWEENISQRKIITGTITAGGVFIFLVVFGIICFIRRWKHFKFSNKGKVTVEPSKGQMRKGEHTIIEDQHDGPEIDFEDFPENRTLESPKHSKGNGRIIDDEPVKHTKQ
jgi:hypothetical protein